MVMVENDVMKSLMKMKTLTGGGIGCDAEYDDEDHHRNITETFYSFASKEEAEEEVVEEVLERRKNLGVVPTDRFVPKNL
jgi:hypothetical protein